MTSWNGFRKLPTLRLGKTQRQTPLNEGIKNGQVIDYKKKLLDILGILKNGSKFRFAEGFWSSSSKLSNLQRVS